MTTAYERETKNPQKPSPVKEHTQVYIIKEENISDQGKIKSALKENGTVNKQQGGYIKCPMKCKKLFPKDQFMVPVALRDHVIKRHKNEEHSELFQNIVNQAPSELKCDICGKVFKAIIYLKLIKSRQYLSKALERNPFSKDKIMGNLVISCWDNDNLELIKDLINDPSITLVSPSMNC